MSDKVIIVENVSKSYVLKHQNTDRYSTLSDTITKTAKSIFTGSRQNQRNEEFWALKDVSFEIKQGERVGIIGRNGAGKSTLLKVLSRIVTPTKGRITIDGRIASLLEVGTGFHPELSGRENIYLNGSILGMSKHEINSKFDEIVAFSEVERFLDTPVKRYSSGMYVRLAFAVAAHLEPEILIVDEVLAVGDAEFQKKCLGKMKDVAGQGRTVLFVSHNMAAIQNLCDKAIYLKKGQVQMVGDSKSTINEYLRSGSEAYTIEIGDRMDRSGNGDVRFQSITLHDNQGNKVQALQSGSPGKMSLSYNKKTSSALNAFHVSVGIDDEFGQRIAYLSNELTNELFNKVENEKGIVEIFFPKMPLKSGRYVITLYSTVNGELADYVVEAGNFDVEDGDFYNTGKSAPPGQGSFNIEHHFSIK
jgi:lipopolysaccharide transport system ATP-binding protein